MEENDTSMGHLEGSRLRLKAIEKPNLGKVDNHLNETWWPEGKQSWKGVFYSEKGVHSVFEYLRTCRVYVRFFFQKKFFILNLKKLFELFPINFEPQNWTRNWLETLSASCSVYHY